MIKKARYLVVLAACFGLLAASPLAAIASGGIGGRPAMPDPKNERTKSIFIYNLSGGQEKQDQLLVSNTTDEIAEIELYAVDATLTPTGEMTCEQKVESRDNVGSWISLAKSELTLAQQSSEIVDFQLKVPGKVDVGEHNGCLIIQRKSEATAQTGGVQLETRQAVRVAVIVPGNIHRDVTIDSFKANNSDGKQTYAIAIKNSGNVSADAKITLRVKDMFGHTVYENGGTYATMADSVRTFNYDSKIDSWHGGFYKAELTLQYDKRAGTFGTSDASQLITKTADSVQFFLWPQFWVIATIISILMLILLSISVRNIRRKRRQKHDSSLNIK